MRTAIIVQFLLTGLLAAAVIALYLENDTPHDAVSADTSTPAEAGRAPDGHALDTQLHDWGNDERLSELETRVEQLSLELSDVRQRADRTVLDVPGSHTEPTEETFRQQHEATILAILADDREREEFAAKTNEARQLLVGFWNEHGLPQADLDRVVAVLVEQGRRTDQILRKFAPDGVWPAADAPERDAWVAAWSDLKAWRREQVLPALDAATADELRALMEKVFEGVFVKPAMQR